MSTGFTVRDILCAAARNEVYELAKDFRRGCAKLVRKGRDHGIRIKFQQPMPEFRVTIEVRKGR